MPDLPRTLGSRPCFSRGSTSMKRCKSSTINNNRKCGDQPKRTSATRKISCPSYWHRSKVNTVGPAVLGLIKTIMIKSFSIRMTLSTRMINSMERRRWSILGESSKRSSTLRMVMILSLPSGAISPSPRRKSITSSLIKLSKSGTKDSQMWSSSILTPNSISRP